jgi:hypothetical protein
VGWVDGPSWVEPLVAMSFVLLTATLAVARIAMFRDEDGRWAPSIGLSNLLEEGNDLRERLNTYRGLGANQRLQMVGSGLIAIALVVLAVRRIANMVYESGLDSWDFDWGEAWDYGAFTIGVGLWWMGFLALRREGRRTSLVVDASKDDRAARAVSSAFADLPAVIDCREGGSAEMFAMRASHPLLANLLTVLGQWHPRRAEKEKPYQRSLHRKLLQLLPAADPKEEVPLRSQHVRHTGRIDILLGHCVLIEMKRRLTTSTAQKALGQVLMYADLWRDKGPLVLLLCDTDAEFAVPFFEPHVRRLRADGCSVVAIMAG